MRWRAVSNEVNMEPERAHDTKILFKTPFDSLNYVNKFLFRSCRCRLCLLLLLTFVVFLRFKSLIVQFASE